MVDPRAVVTRQYSVGLMSIKLFLPDLVGPTALLLGGSCIVFARELVIGATRPTPTGGPRTSSLQVRSDA